MLFIFDMGGVVTNTFNFDFFFEKVGLSKEDFYSLCRSGNNIWDDLEKGKIDVNQFWKEFNSKVSQLKTVDNKFEKVPFVENDLFRLYFHPSKNMKTVELIQELKKKHRVVCGTNTIQSHWENHMERGDYGFFNQTYASNKIGESKPNPNFFKLILEAEGYEAKDAFFVDDKIENVEAAKSVGINAVQFTTAENLWDCWKQYL